MTYPDGVSLIVCTYNGAKLLPETLKHVMAQITGQGLQWEFLLIDNASSDNTSEIADKLWDSNIPMRIILEEEKGLIHARYRGIAEAKYEIISFIDDDNWIDPRWVQNIYGLFKSMPEVGLCGGKNTGVFEVDPPEWVYNILGAFAVGEQAKTSGDVTEKPGHVWGAGMSFRKSVFEDFLEQGFRSILTGRKGKNLSAGEDTELAFAFRMGGWKIWYSEELELSHFITKGRLNWSYVRKMYKGFGTSHAIFELYKRSLKDQPLSKGYIYYKLIRAYLPFLVWHILHLPVNTVGNKKELLYSFHGYKVRQAILMFFRMRTIYEEINVVKERIRIARKKNAVK